MEAQPQLLMEVVGKWQALNPIGMFFSLAQRRITVILEVPNEDTLFEALHLTWVAAKSYPEVWPVADAEEFPALLRRAGLGP